MKPPSYLCGMLVVLGCAGGAPEASAPANVATSAAPAETTPDAAVAAPVAIATPRATCGAELGREWSRIGDGGDPAAVSVKLLAAFATACATAAPGLAQAARTAAVANVDARARALADGAHAELDPICKFASTEPMAEHPELPRCLAKFERPDVASTQPYWKGHDPGILCDVNVGTYLFIVAAEPYLGDDAHLLARLMLAAAHEGSNLKRVCWAHHR